MNRKNEEAAKKAKELKKLLKNASNEELVTLINEVCEELTVSQLRKPAVKYRAEAILYYKKPKVNKTTRVVYRRFVELIRNCATEINNSQIITSVSNFEKAYLA